ncbi:MAG: hypothetical protein ACR2JC_04065 [Chloroflexota bacterium]|nr:MAG: hypothetical protein DLM70_10600 [Chloroflexota bacterium]
MDTTISFAELNRRLADILEQVRSEHRSFLIEQDNEAVASLRPVAARARVTWSDLADGLGDMQDADASFGDDLEEIQRCQPPVPDSMWRT